MNAYVDIKLVKIDTFATTNSQSIKDFKNTW